MVPRWDCGGSTSPSNSWLGPKFDRPLNSAVLLTHCGQLILRKISKFDVTKCQILRLKCTKFDFRWGSAADAGGGANIVIFPQIVMMRQEALCFKDVCLSVRVCVLERRRSPTGLLSTSSCLLLFHYCVSFWFRMLDKNSIGCRR